MQDLKKLIRELVEEIIDETTTTGAVAGYQTPNAFSKKGSKKMDKVAKDSMPGGELAESLPVTQDELTENRYRNFKNSDLMKNHAKISYGINQAKKTLREVDFLVGLCERLQTEDKIGGTQLWKRTRPDLMAINKQLKEISKRVYRIGKR